MINYIRIFILLIFSATAFSALAQTSATTSSPYSKIGLGSWEDALLPQNRALGGLGAALPKTGGYNDINIINPASYSNINLTTIDMGLTVSADMLSQTGSTTQTSSNFRLSHVAFAIPVSHHSALSFGLVPYTSVGYNYAQTGSVKINNASSGGIDTSSAVNYRYTGEGGLSKAYLGYGFGIGRNLHLGFNVSYIFGNETILSSTEFPELPAALNSTIENSMSAGGLNYDYGLQYYINLNLTTHIVLGYSGSASTSLSTNNKFIVSQYTLNADGTTNLALDSLRNEQTTGKIKLPNINRFGVTLLKDNKFMIGAEYKIGSWSNVTINGANAGLQNDQNFSFGAQLTPDINSINSYLAVVDYRIGFNYDKTYINYGGVNITQYGATVGLGIPIPNTSRTDFYKVNLAIEVGRRGTLENNLIRENYFNFHLGFTLNDKWFQKFKFD